MKISVNQKNGGGRQKTWKNLKKVRLAQCLNKKWPISIMQISK